VVKHWQEMADIVDRVLRLREERRPAALAIVTSISGSAYRRPGAKLLIETEGAVLGGVSGGCLEEDVRRVALGVMKTGRSRALHYETGDDDTKLWGLGLGCDGQIDVLVLPLPGDPGAESWAELRDRLAGDAAFALAAVVEDEGPGGFLVVDASGRAVASPGATADAQIADVARAALDARQTGLTTVGARRIFTEVLVPPPKLLVCGAGDDARPLVNFAAGVGFRVVVADHRPAYLTAERFPAARKLVQLRPENESDELPSDPTTYAVVKTHSLEHDTTWVRRLLASDVSYVGVLGPRARIRRILDRLAVRDGEGRVFGPVGLDVGADGPEQVALSVVAEVLAVWSRRTPRHLRELEGTLHAR
jgi:xanthine dehydrogenase accessory factor